MKYGNAVIYSSEDLEPKKEMEVLLERFARNCAHIKGPITFIYRQEPTLGSDVCSVNWCAEE